MMTKLIFLLGVLCTPWTLSAHQPDISSTILVEQSENVWVLQVRAALTAFEYVVEERFGADAYATPEEFRELVVDYVTENVSVRYNDAELAPLKDGGVKLGHEASVTFRVTGIPEDARSLAVSNTTFSNISRNQSALMVLKEGFAKKQFMLDNTNAHTAKLKLSNADFVLVAPGAERSAYLFPLLLIVALLAAVLGYLFFQNKDSVFPVGA